MGLSLLQHGANGPTNSGSSGQVLPGLCATGTCVLLAIATQDPANSSGIVSSISSSIGTFTKVGVFPVSSSAYINIEYWVCLRTTGSADTITVNTSSSSQWSAHAEEWYGGVASATLSSNSGSSTSPSITVTGLTAGQVVSVNLNTGTGGAVNSSPTSPWTTETSNGWSNFQGTGPGAPAAAWQVVSGSSVTATWSTVFNNTWDAIACVLTPASSGGFFEFL